MERIYNIERKDRSVLGLLIELSTFITISFVKLTKNNGFLYFTQF